jgi:hypothetical protein
MLGEPRVSPELWTPADFAAYAKLTPAQVSHLRRSGKGPAFTKLGKHVRYVPGVVHRWVIENQEAAAKENAK